MVVGILLILPAKAEGGAAGSAGMGISGDTAGDTASPGAVVSGAEIDTFGTDTTQDLSRVLIYPNPYIPYDGNFESGRPYSKGDNTTGIIFRNVSPQVDIRIYTAAGRLVKAISATSTGGNIQWDARNDENRELATGVYFAVFSSVRGSAIKKFMIVR